MFEERARGSELLDAPDSDPRLTEEGYRFMRRVNRIGGGVRIVRRFLAAELAKRPKDTPVRILDIGVGGGDIPLALVRWAREQDYRIEFTCVDHNLKALEVTQRAIDGSTGDATCAGSPNASLRASGGQLSTLYTAETCKELRVDPYNDCDAVRPPIGLVQADIFGYEPIHDFDYATGSMVFHHFTEDEIHRLIAHLRGFVRRALLINDLHRNLLNYLVGGMLAVPLDREIRHDALLSIRRGFKPAELRAILRKHDPAAVVTRSWFSRVAGVVRFDR